MIEIAKNYCDIEKSHVNFLFYKAVSASSAPERIKFLREITQTTTFDKELESRLWIGLDLVWNSSLSLNHQDNDERSKAIQYLEIVLDKAPHNPAAAHYWIHGWEDTKYPEIALPQAKILPVYAGNSGHLVHMPGHIYHRMGNYNQAVKEFQNAAKVDRDYLEFRVSILLNEMNEVVIYLS